jgi:hypothetical protein
VRTRPGCRGRAVALLAAMLAVAGCTDAGSGQPPSPAGTAKPGHVPVTATPDDTAVPVPASPSNDDVARFAGPVAKYADQAGVNPQLLMAILYNESYKPHDPAAERAWQRIKPDAAFGIANMHKAAFDDTKRRRDFADRDWQELPDDPALAIEAAAWYLHDLAAQLPATWPGSYTRDELLALGYNVGASNMTAFARGATPTGTTRDYLDRLHANWAVAGRAIGR